MILVKGEDALDLSDFRIVFKTGQADTQSPNNCRIRVFNLKAETVAQVKGEYSEVVLQAGYQNGNFGVIFRGTIRQFVTGKDENGTDTYLDLLAADGDTLYNWGFINRSFPAGSTPKDRAQTMADKAVDSTGQLLAAMGHNGIAGVLPAPRGKVVFGLMRVALTAEAGAQGCTWSIQNGKINILPIDGYLPNEAVVLSSTTGLVGRAEQTNEGVHARSLLNPLLQPGGLIKIDNASVNQTSNADAKSTVMVPYNQWTGAQFLADVTADGLYRVFVVEHEGDSRGGNWYSNIVALAVNPSTGKVSAQ